MKKYLVSIVLTVVFAVIAAVQSYASEVVVYSARKDHLIRPLFEAYKKETGVDVKYITGKAAPLMQRLKSEGENTSADMLLTVDAGNLWNAAHEGLLQPVDSKVLQNNIPSHLRDADNQWFGLSVRARTIVYSTERLKAEDLSTYEDLANSKWKGKLCLRTSKKVYNQSLIAMFIAQYGEQKTEDIVKGWVANLATEPFSNDTKVMEAIVAKQCDAGIVNTYYFGRLQKKDPEVPLALFWPNQTSGEAGVHVNVSGAGITKYAKHKKEAVKLLEWLSSEKAQNLFADSNMEYPVNPRVKPDEAVAKWGDFKQNVINVTNAGKLQKKAVMLMDRAGYR